VNNAPELIKDGKCTLSTAICTRDDIMGFLIQCGVENGLAFTIMESVRKGRGLKPEMEQAMLAANVPDWYIWSCKQIKYMFPKAHAVAYVTMAFRIAYFKVYYPLAYYAAFFSIRATSFNYSLMCRGKEALDYQIAEFKRRDKGAKKKGTTPQEDKEQAESGALSSKEEDTLRDMKIVQEMYARGLSFLPIDIYHSKARSFQIVDGKLLPPFTAIDGMGEKAAEAVVDAALDGPFLSREDFRNRTKVSQTVIDTMQELGLFGDLPETNQISLTDFLTM